jgi:Family of unknown function (DUF5988)
MVRGAMNWGNSGKEPSMDDTALSTVGTNFVQAVLEGGPESIPAASRVRQVGPLEQKIKLPHYGGYEHFERIDGLVEDPSCRHIVFRWTMRTKMAE